MPELPDRIPGEIILASYNNDQRDRLVERYIDATARSVSTPLPVAGTVSYLTASGKFSIFDGTTWVDFIDVRGNQTIVGRTFMGSVTLNDGFLEWLGTNIRLVSNAVDLMRFKRDEMVEHVIDTSFVGRIINDPDDVPSTRAQIRFGIGGSNAIESQIYGSANGLMALDADKLAVSLTNSTSLDNRVVYPSINTVVPNPVGGALWELMRFSGSSEQYKDVQAAGMTKAHSHHPVHLLNVEFKRWSYKDGYLVAGDPRGSGEDWLAPTAETMEAAYPWAVDPDDAGNPGDINSKVLTEGLLWLVQDLSARLEALENA